jgi:hypothetical protein
MVPYTRLKHFSEYIIEAFYGLCVQNNLCLPEKVETNYSTIYGREIENCWKSDTRAVLENLDLVLTVKVTMNADDCLVVVDIIMDIKPGDGQEKIVRISDEVYINEKLESGALFANLFTQNTQATFDSLLETLETFIPSFKKLCKSF